jgi:hypothetical protein
LRVMMRNCMFFLYFAQHDAHFNRPISYRLIAMNCAL